MKKLSKILSTIILVILIILISLLGIPRLFKVGIYAVESGSMTPKYKVGDIVYAVPAKFEDIEVGDVITYVLNEDLVLSTHRVVEVDEENQQFYTKGDANQAQDGSPVLYPNVVGVVRFSLPRLGLIYIGLKTTLGKIIAGTLVIVIILIMIIIKINSSDEGDGPPDTKGNKKEKKNKQNVPQTGQGKEGEMKNKNTMPPGWGTGKVKRSSNKKKVFISLLSMFCLIGVTLAFMYYQIQARTNQVNAAQIPIDIIEDFGDPDITEENVEWGTENKKVTIQNVGNTTCVVRAMIVPMFLNAQGDYVDVDFSDLKAPEGNTMEVGDFTLHFADSYAGGISSNWFYKDNDGFFYYRKVLDEKGGTRDTTTELLQGITITDPANKDKYKDIYIHLEIMADSIQARGPAAQTEWGITIAGDDVNP